MRCASKSPFGFWRRILYSPLGMRYCVSLAFFENGSATTQKVSGFALARTREFSPRFLVHPARFSDTLEREPSESVRLRPRTNS